MSMSTMTIWSLPSASGQFSTGSAGVAFAEETSILRSLVVPTQAPLLLVVVLTQFLVVLALTQSLVVLELIPLEGGAGDDTLVGGMNGDT